MLKWQQWRWDPEHFLLLFTTHFLPWWNTISIKKILKISQSQRHYSNIKMISS